MLYLVPMSPDSLKVFAAELVSLLGCEAAAIDTKTSSPASGKAGRTVIRISSPDSARLIGPHGEHLRALNVIARRLIEQKCGEESANFSLDVNSYHEAQMERVRAQARMLAQRARLFKHEVDMPPMSPYERLIIHELFAEDPEIKTESAGEGKFRHIVLKYRDKALVS